MKIGHAIVCLTVVARMGVCVGEISANETTALPDGWTPKFYHGLEAVGSVECMPMGFKGKSAAIRLKWESGAMKFGAAKEVSTALTGFINWTVSAQVRSEGDYGYAGAAMEFFDAAGKSIGIVGSPRPMVSKVWRKMNQTGRHLFRRFDFNRKLHSF